MASIKEGLFEVPDSGEYPIAYFEAVGVGKVPSGSLAYLHAVRSDVGKIFPDLLELRKKAYDAELPAIAAALTAWATGRDFDAILRVPSSRDDSVPLFNAILSAKPHATDLSGHFSKRTGWRAGRGTSVAQARDAIQTSDFDATVFRSLAIVDETLSSGTSVAAVIANLRAAGLHSDARITLVTSLVMNTVKAAN